MQKLKLLWQGYLPLETTFWQYAILYGLLLNIVTTVAALFLVVLDVPIAYAAIVHLLPVPYLILTAVGVWRSADRYGHHGNFPLFARLAVLAWSAFWFVA
ncbi:hypothetical protein [Dongia deserti]|uniref:hypothetical protein n=1 Tax=Dongia deserti TaxID=2268030 RepID=UPI0013C46386|nr:hypothetical protein [Dongia deserti]